MKRNLLNFAASEIVTSIILLMLVIVVLSTAYLNFFPNLDPDDNTFVTIAGKVQRKELILEHQGGEILSLSTPVTLTIAGTEYNILVEDYLEDENNDNHWSLGERMIFPFEYDVHNLRNYLQIDITAVDKEDNEIILNGPIELHPVSDIGIEVFVNDLYPEIGDIVTFTIIVTCYGGDVNGSVDVKIQYIIPSGLEYVNSTAQRGSYNNSTGIWNIDLLLENQPTTLNIDAKVVAFGTIGFTELAMNLDGSGSIQSSDWELMRTGLANAIENPNIFPHDGSVELTVIQFGVDNNRARVEISPTIVTSDNYNFVGNQIRGLSQGRGWTPMAAGLYLATDTVKNSVNFDVNERQVLCIVTDGEPTCESDEGEYFGYNCGTSSSQINAAKSSAESASSYAITELQMTSEQDELNSIAVGSGPDIEWLNSSIVWPQPGYLAPPFNQGSGWVSFVETWEEFAEVIEEMFKLLFQGINNRVELYDAFTVDLVPYNNADVIVLMPYED
jgi:uncharacterized repeat protein (TIGR01451 family)